MKRLEHAMIDSPRLRRGTNFLALLQSTDIFFDYYQTFHVWLPSSCASGANIETLNTLQGVRNVMGKWSLAGEIWLFLRQNKKYWMLPILLILLLMSVLLVFAQSSALAPFIYTLF